MPSSPTKKKRAEGVRCADCGFVIKRVPKANNGWGHKNRKHWVDKPHKARPRTT